MSDLFPITSFWSWGTFLLYLFVGYCVRFLCQAGEKRNIALHSNRFNIYYVISVVVLVILATIRNSSVGPDTQSYVDEYLNASTVSFSWEKLLTFSQGEIGFQCYLVFLRSISSSYRFLFFVTYTFIALSYVAYIKCFVSRETGYTFLPLFIFFYVGNMSGMRSAIGMAFIILSLILLSKNKYLMAIVITFVGFLFHYTIIINLVIILVSWILRKQSSYKKWKWILLLIISIVLSLAFISSFRGVLAETKYYYYSSVDSSEKSFLGSLVYVLLAALTMVFFKTFNTKPKTQYQMSIFWSFLLIYPAVYFVGAYRIPNYYCLPRLSLWSSSSNCINRSRDIFIGCLLNVLVILYLLFRFTKMSVNGAFEYSILGGW